MEKMELVNVLNHIKFKGLENKKTGDALYFLLDTMEIECLMKFNRLRAMFRVLRGTLYRNIEFTKQKNGNIVFLFSNSYSQRNDYRGWFDKITSLCSDKCVITPAKRRFRVNRINYIKYFFAWMGQCREAGIDENTRMLLCSVLYEGFLNYCDIVRGLEGIDVRLLTSVCDTHLIDSLVVQEYNSRGIDTATLQHGSFSASWVLEASPSKYFLAYGKFTEEQCILSGVPPEKVKILGMPQQIEAAQARKIYINEKKAIGIIFSGGRYAADDIEMLKIALEYSRKMEYEVYVKLHPGYGTEMYEFDGWKDISGIFSNEITVEQFAQKVKFSIAAGSTVLVEYMMKLIPIFSYDGQYKIYENIIWCKFKDAIELEYLTKKYFEDVALLEKEMLETKKYFCIDGDIGKHYRLFFEQYENNMKGSR